MRRLLLARHAHARSNADDRINSRPPGEGLSDLGREEARALGKALADEPIELGVASPLARAQETLDLALGDRDVPRLVLPSLGEIGFGSFEGGPLEPYRTWCWTNEPDALCPGGGESRSAVAARIAGALEELLARTEAVILAVSHALPIRYVLDASDGLVPAARITPVPHATALELEEDAVERAAETLRVWGGSPRFSEPRV